jgi:hypothetical protein
LEIKTNKLENKDCETKYEEDEEQRGNIKSEIETLKRSRHGI